MEEKTTTLYGLYHGNNIHFLGEPRLDAEGKLKVFGMAYSVGWDIPTLWAIDQDNVCWANDAHGGHLVRVEVNRLMYELADEPGQQVSAREHLGMKPLVPSWIKAALAAGWTPTPEFDRELYEW